MKLAKLAVLGSLAALLAVPAGAQTAQTVPGKSAPSLSTQAASPTMSPTTKAMPAPAAHTGTASALVDINTASAAELDALPGIGKARADAIIKNRPYTGKDDLLSRHIVPPNVYNGLKDKIVARKL